MAAAVSDFRVANKAPQKIKKMESMTLELVKNPDILKELGGHKTHQLLVGFAAETEHVVDYGMDKVRRKNLDMLVANDAVSYTHLCPGSFDPVTNGHVDIFERGSRLVDKLIIAVSSNPNKNSLFTMEERVEMIRNAVKHIPNVEIDCTGGLLIDYVKSKNASIIIRGLRALSDFEYEFQRALFAKYLDDDIETVFIMTNNKYSFVSSTGIRELAKFGGKLDGLVPDDVKIKLEKRFNIDGNK